MISSNIGQSIRKHRVTQQPLTLDTKGEEKEDVSSQRYDFTVLPSPSEIVSNVLMEYNQSKMTPRTNTLSEARHIHPPQMHFDYSEPESTESCFSEYSSSPDSDPSIQFRMTKRTQQQWPIPIDPNEHSSTNYTFKHKYIPQKIKPKCSVISSWNESKLEDALRVTHLHSPRRVKRIEIKSEPKELPSPTTYLKLSTMEDTTAAHCKEISDMELFKPSNPKHNRKVTELLKIELGPKSLFQLHPTRLFQFDFAMHTTRNRIRTPNIKFKAQTARSYKSEMRRTQLIDRRERVIFNENRQRYLPAAQQMLTSQTPKSQVTTRSNMNAVPYKSKTMTMRNECLRFRRKWT